MSTKDESFKRLQYSRDFLLKYQHVKSDDPACKVLWSNETKDDEHSTKWRRCSSGRNQGCKLSPSPSKRRPTSEPRPANAKQELLRKTKPLVQATEEAELTLIDDAFVPAEEEGDESPKRLTRSPPKAVDEHQLEQRQKQIDYGCQTLGYLRFRIMVPKDKRSRDDPRTPKKTQACSKRSWDGQIKKWRRDLHKWDPEDPAAFITELESVFLAQHSVNDSDLSHPELVDLIQKVKDRITKFENSPPPSPSPPRAKPHSHGDDMEDREKVARKLLF